MAAWTREDTKIWLHDQHLKLEDVDYYLKQTVEWLEERDHTDQEVVFACSFMTIIWVNHLRGDLTSKREIFELLEIDNWQSVEDQYYQLPASYVEMQLDHEELLELVVRNRPR